MSEWLGEFYASPKTHALADQALAWGARLLVAILILLVGWWLSRRLAGTTQRVLLRTGADPLLGSFLRNLVFVLLITMVVIGAFQSVGVPTASLLAALGAAGLAIGLALQGSLSNLAAGVLLMVFRPFRVGQYVEVAGVGGTVQSVSLMHTILLTPDNREVILPNAKVAGDVIVNVNARGTRRLDLVVGIALDADIGKAIAIAREVLAADTRVLGEPKPDVIVTQLTDARISLTLQPWVNSADYTRVQGDTLRAVKERFDAAGVRLPTSQHEVVLREIVPAQPH
jgi:small conductance mechanosensitive channel